MLFERSSRWVERCFFLKAPHLKHPDNEIAYDMRSLLTLSFSIHKEAHHQIQTKETTKGEHSEYNEETEERAKRGQRVGQCQPIGRRLSQSLALAPLRTPSSLVWFEQTISQRHNENRSVAYNKERQRGRELTASMTFPFTLSWKQPTSVPRQPARFVHSTTIKPHIPCPESV